MNFRRLLAMTAIPFLIGTFGFVASAENANAEPNSHQIAQAQLPRPDDKQDEHPKPPHPHPPHPRNERPQDRDRVEDRRP